MNIVIKIALLSIVCQEINSARSNKKKQVQPEQFIDDGEDDESCFLLKTMDESVLEVYPSLKGVNLEDLKSQIKGYQNLKKLGEGGNGTVYDLIPKSNKGNRPLKSVALKYQLIDFELEENLLEEVDNYVILSDTKGIPLLHGCFYRNSGQAGKMEYFLLQTKLHHDLNQPQFLDKKEKKKNPKNILNALPNKSARYRFYQQIFEAVDAMAKKNLVHNDLKPENMMVDEGGYQNGPYLIDFGLTTNKNEAAQVTTICYEFINKKKSTINTQHLDVYSAAVSVLELEYGPENVCQIFWEEVGENYKDLNVSQPTKNLFKDIVNRVIDQETFTPFKNDLTKSQKISDCDNLNCIILHSLSHNVKQIPSAAMVVKAFSNILQKKKII